MKYLFLFFFSVAGFATTPVNSQSVTLNKMLELKMPKDKGDDLCGTRGAGVCWNPVTKRYFAGFAGNAGFPLGIFDAKGNRVSPVDMTTLVDLRGIWYDPSARTVCGNGYSETGWFSYKPDAKGIPSGYNIDIAGSYQPDANSVGTFNPAKKEVIFLNEGAVSIYKMDGTNDRTVTLQMNTKKAENNSGEQGSDNSPDQYNTSSVIYTGIPGSELGVLNITKKQIELFDYTSGEKGKTLALPENTPVEVVFNFAYANGNYWLFDIETRTWLGFR